MSKRYALHSDKIVPIALFIALTVLSLNSVFALSYEANNEDESIANAGTVDPPSQQIPDIILKNFVLPNETYVNESVQGYFEIEVVNITGITFVSALIANNYTEEFRINESGIYNITPFVFDTDGIFDVSLTIDQQNEINETDEDNNQKTLKITVIPAINTENTNQATEQATDIILDNFVIDRNEILVNDSVHGSFDIEIANSTNSSFGAVLSIDGMGYREEFNISAPGNYSIMPILFSSYGNFTINLVLDPQNHINETDEGNNVLSLYVVVIPHASEPVSEGNIIIGRTRTFIYLSGKLIKTIDNDGTALYYHHDAQNNVRLATDENGNVVQENYYEPFGNTWTLSNPNFNNRKFSGKEDDTSRMTYFGARYYDMSAGRWISLDPAQNPSESGYSYAKNSPLTYGDPDGNKPAKNSRIDYREQERYFTFNPSTVNYMTRPSGKDRESLDDFNANPGKVFMTNSAARSALLVIPKIFQAALEFKLGNDPNYHDPEFVKSFNTFFMEHGVKYPSLLEMPARYRYSVALHGLDSEPTHQNPMPVSKENLVTVMGSISSKEDYYTFTYLVESQETSISTFTDVRANLPVFRDPYNIADRNDIYFNKFGLKLDARLKEAYYAMRNRVLYGLEPQSETQIVNGRR